MAKPHQLSIAASFLLITLIFPSNNIKFYVAARRLTDIPAVSQPELPAMSGLSGINWPPFPNLSSLPIPKLPEIPNLVDLFPDMNLPELPKPTLVPAFPVYPQETQKSLVTETHSNTNP